MRIGCTPFLNARPLVWGLERDHEVVPLPPRRMARALLSGRVDVALVPVVDLFRDRRLAMLRAPAIGCDGPVLSVRLLSRDAIGASVRLLADSRSGTSVLLAVLLLKRMFGVRDVRVRQVDTRRFDPRRIRQGEALLQIGDVALKNAPRGLRTHDLGTLWRVMTGLPFVFAPWMALRGRVPRGAAALLRRAVRQGMRDPHRVARAFAPKGLPPSEAVRYLTVNLSFRVGATERRAIRLFGRLLRAEGLL
jgi:chorismate dehydratase